jgi:hypothetical protein
MTNAPSVWFFDAVVTIECDNPRHARGKVAKIASLGRDKEGRWTVTRSADRGRRYTKRSARMAAAGVQPKVEDDPDLRCKLCGQGLGRLSKCGPMLVPILNQIVTQHVSRITLSQLIRSSI